MSRAWLAALCLVACKERIPKLEHACVAQRDCVITRQRDDCCFACEPEAGTVVSVSARTAFCGKSAASCPELKCLEKSVTAYCLEDRCVVRGL